MSWFAELHPVAQALLAGLFTCGVTALGAAIVAVRGLRPGATFDAMLGFASGVMLAASFWSLLAPAIDIAALQGQTPWIIVAAGFASGALFLAVADRVLPHLHPATTRPQGPRSGWSRTTGAASASLPGPLPHSRTPWRP
jgi:ZIP family zinc transporter